MPRPLSVTFVGGATGAWEITSISAIAGATLPDARRLEMVEGPVSDTSNACWILRGTTSNERSVEDSSHHIAIGLEYVASIARRLHHGRDLGESFDFVTWFEFAPTEVGFFDELLGRLRATHEWTYIEHEVDVRLSR